MEALLVPLPQEEGELVDEAQNELVCVPVPLPLVVDDKEGLTLPETVEVIVSVPEEEDVKHIVGLPLTVELGLGEAVEQNEEL